MHRYSGVCALILLTMWSGCGEKEPPPPTASKLVPAEGVVTLAGEPLDGATVIFNPNSQDGMVAYGYTDSKGHYAAETRSGGNIEPGIAPGSYQVIISRMMKPDGTLLDPAEPPAMSAASESVPMQYSSPGDSKLRAVVGQSGGTFDFELK